MATLKLVFGFVLFGMWRWCATSSFRVLRELRARGFDQDEATQSTYSTRSEDDIRRLLSNRLGLRYSAYAEQVHVLRVGSFGTGTSPSMRVQRSIDLPGTRPPSISIFVAELGVY